METVIRITAILAFLFVVICAISWFALKINNIKIPRQNWEACMIAKMHNRPDSVYPIADRLCKQRGAEQWNYQARA